MPASERCTASRWQAAVADPVRDIGQGLALVARAMWRLVAGLAGYAEYLTAGRGRVLQRWESNAP
ncbi:MAG: hypothetical protein QE265_02400 [Rhodoferax sp.]|nr:hypothetical protein [Rhodoferax sp.]